MYLCDLGQLSFCRIFLSNVLLRRRLADLPIVKIDLKINFFVYESKRLLSEKSGSLKEVIEKHKIGLEIAQKN